MSDAPPAGSSSNRPSTPSDAPPLAPADRAIVEAAPKGPRSASDKLRGHAAMIRSGAFTPGQDEEWFAASLERIAAEVDALAARLAEAGNE